ncbi:hypothetical protein CBL_06164 [Carabus blaptoides fortunei]
MSLSVMSVAMQLSGLEPQHFTNGDVKVRWLYEDGARKLQASSPALSTTSSTSSSGFNSWGSDAQNVKEDLTIVNVIPPEIQKKSEIMYLGANLLDLGNNLTNSKWNMQYSELRKDAQNFFDNRSQYSRVNEDNVPLHVDINCEHCEFITSHY